MTGRAPSAQSCPIAAFLVQCSQCRKFRVLKQNLSNSPKGMLHSESKSYAVPRDAVPARLSLPEYHPRLVGGRKRTNRHLSTPVFALNKLIFRLASVDSCARTGTTTRARLLLSLGNSDLSLRNQQDTHSLPLTCFLAMRHFCPGITHTPAKCPHPDTFC